MQIYHQTCFGNGHGINLWREVVHSEQGGANESMRARPHRLCEALRVVDMCLLPGGMSSQGLEVIVVFARIYTNVSVYMMAVLSHCLRGLERF